MTRLEQIILESVRDAIMDEVTLRKPTWYGYKKISVSGRNPKDWKMLSDIRFDREMDTKKKAIRNRNDNDERDSFDYWNKKSDKERKNRKRDFENYIDLTCHI